MRASRLRYSGSIPPGTPESELPAVPPGGSSTATPYTCTPDDKLSLVDADFGVRVNAVKPGWVDSGILTEPYEAATLTPVCRNGSPEDLAKVVAFLLSFEAAFMTGASIVADGKIHRRRLLHAEGG
jgi:hypothetical protein